ncbi:MAG: alpha-hydroxy-acid oxidizing protein [Legionellales bacterium]|nr:alpha-hydroxy-acid oxidizing protein [Legionellales bacterium]
MADKYFPDIDTLAEYAKQHLTQPIYDYFFGGASNEVTLRSNCSIYNKISFIPRVLTGLTDPDTSILINQLELANPLIVAPTAYHGLLHKNGEIETAHGAKQAHVIYCQSLMSTSSLSATTKVSPDLWMQVYVLAERDKFETLLNLCKEHNIVNIIITVDSAYLGMRRNDHVQHHVLPESMPLHVLNAIDIDKNNRHYKNQSLFAKDISWDELLEIKQSSNANIYLKGILHPRDAELAAQKGFAGIILSNHGGRQLDTTVHPLQVLEKIRLNVGNKFPIIIDGGLTSGFDVLKTLCLGANAVMIGKPILWALHHSGREGVKNLLVRMLAELINGMRLCGISKLNELHLYGRDYIYWE